jgi:hypothetical protein
MALTKVTKHIIYGSTLIGHYGRDISDVTTTSGTYTQWGEDVLYTPQYADSHMEVCVTGSAFTTSNVGTGHSGGNCRLMANTAEIYTVANAISHINNHSGTRHFYNPRFSQHNARQQFHANNFGTGVYMSTIYHPNTVNQITFECEAASTNSMTVQWTDGYMTVTEISGPGYNLT